MPGDETSRIDEWLYATLHGDATLLALLNTGADPLTGVYSEEAPEGAGYPFVRTVWQGGADVGTHNATRIMHSGLWIVTGVQRGTSFQGTLQDIADRLDVLLDRSAGGTASGASIFTSVREGPFRLAELTDGVSYRHLGGLFRVYAQLP